ncbi:unnamed protein product [Effrenium voratum]|nr:unnamed protein product [Effrenium voratum]
MSTWSRMSSARFGKEEESTIGPGSYEIPTTMDENGVSIAPNGDRFVESVEGPAPGFYVFEEAEKVKTQERRKSRGRALSAAKENRAPSSLTPRPDKNEKLDESDLRRRLLDEEKRRCQAEARANDLALAKKAAANAHAQLQSQERKIEQLQKELEDTGLLRKEAQKRACDLEAEKGRAKKA